MVTRNRPRFRDIWNMHWVTGDGTAIRNGRVRAKMKDHRVESAWLEVAADRAGDIVRSVEFGAEMRRFLLPNVAVQALDNPLYMEFPDGETVVLAPEGLSLNWPGICSVTDTLSRQQRKHRKWHRTDQDRDGTRCDIKPIDDI